VGQFNIHSYEMARVHCAAMMLAAVNETTGAVSLAYVPSGEQNQDDR